MAMNQNIKDIMFLSLVVGQAGLIGYKISKLVMGYKLKKKLNEDIQFAEKMIAEDTQHNEELRAKIYNDSNTTDTEKDAKFYHCNMWQRDIDRYDGYKLESRYVLNYVNDITKV